MVTARSGQPFEATLEGVATGLVGDVALTVDDAQGDAVIARSADDIVELSDASDDPGRGVYRATRTAPTLDDGSGPVTHTLVWDLGDPDDAETTYTEDLTVWVAPTFAFLPSVAEVAALIRARLTSEHGADLGGFTNATSPTQTQVQDFIYQAAGRVAVAVGTTMADPNLLAAARALVVVRAAMMAELSLSLDRLDSDRAIYDRLKTEWDEGKAELIEAVAESGVGGGGESVAGGGPLPTGCFPPAPCDPEDGSRYLDPRRVHVGYD
jgi:hypothetical protein